MYQECTNLWIQCHIFVDQNCLLGGNEFINFNLISPAKSGREPSAAKDYSPASASDLSLLSALKLADDVRQQQDSQRSEVNISGIILF